MSKYSVEEVREEAASFARVFNDRVCTMLTDYADLRERIAADEGVAEHPLIIATLREGSIIRGITFTSKGGAEISFRFEGCDPNTSEKILSGTADFGKPPAQAAQVSDALPAAVKACDEEMQKYGHKFAGAVAGDAMRAALLTVWPNPPAQADEGSVPPIPTEIDWTHLKAFVTLGFYDEAQCQKFIQLAQGAHPPAQAAQVEESPMFAVSRSAHSYYTRDPEEARQAAFDGAQVREIIMGAPAAQPVAQGESLERCDTCDGEGEVYAAGASSREACSDCDGSGITAAPSPGESK